MNGKARDIGGYSFHPHDELLFDTNIWLTLFGPQGGPPRSVAQIYSAAFKAVLQAGSKIYLDVLILSEFINRYARVRHNLLKNAGKAPADFKRFRQSHAFKPIARDVDGDARRLLKHCQLVESGLSTVDMNALLAEYSNGNSDFNDQILAELCRSKRLTLVTDDADFGGRGMTILTANRKLLR